VVRTGLISMARKTELKIANAKVAKKLKHRKK
jgi:hypothetical protein